MSCKLQAHDLFLLSFTEIVLLSVDIRAEPPIWQWRGDCRARQLGQKQSLRVYMFYKITCWYDGVSVCSSEKIGDHMVYVSVFSNKQRSFEH